MKQLVNILIGLILFAGVISSCTVMHDASAPNASGQIYKTSTLHFGLFSFDSVERCQAGADGKLQCVDLDVQFTGGTF